MAKPIVVFIAFVAALAPAALHAKPTCLPDNGGLTLPDGFCALIVAKGLGPVRHLAVAPNGDLFAAIARESGGIVVLRDTDGDGKADVTKRSGDSGGHGLALAADAVYFAPDDRVLRYPWKPGSLEPAGPPETIVKDLPTGGHSTKTLVLLPDGGLLVSIGSRTNSCQERDRQLKSPGKKPCTELETRAGIWRFDARKPNQTEADGKRYATGLRNSVAMALEPKTGQLYITTHGRDQLGENWGFSKEDNAENPAEEFAAIKQGDDLGWPYCYYDPRAKKKVQAPEFGGDGKLTTDCDKRSQPAIGFPAHYAPIALAFYTGSLFPQEYRGGAFLSFHGSWNRAPLPQAGYRVVFIPFKNNVPTGEWRDFAKPTKSPVGIRPTGLAVGTDGSLFIGADADQTIWRVLRK
jgi:glucose/arabinose dehydrogenase